MRTNYTISIEMPVCAETDLVDIMNESEYRNIRYTRVKADGPGGFPEYRYEGSISDIVHLLNELYDVDMSDIGDYLDSSDIVPNPTEGAHFRK